MTINEPQEMMRLAGERADKKMPLPKPGRVHPGEGGFTHRRGKPLVDGNGESINDLPRKGEVIKKTRKTVCGLRDKMACSRSTAKQTRLINTNGRVDERLDMANEPAPCLIPPAPRREVKRARSSHRMAGRLLS